ncbi:EthD domain-containing protein [Tomitella biformata]|uniref:EthD domain-containing protein n=1 Tax=Tomitella biformata TaxID=630403 RepID=UPI000463C675|nr:EthD domain-containing protein [Tomitella biformata]
MIKAIALLTRRAGLTRAEFIDYYENSHAPLIRRLLPQIREYRRNFVDLEGALRAPGVPDPTFDVITELWFDDRAGYAAMLATHGQPEIRAQIEADEARFLDRGKTIQFLVDEAG